ncbi:hypothetical protein FALBO_7379 [Fusarium albosuccineum]|uniref:Uncharacterized protein n=1 Tax=Fusarium albosuccineum TaxID=1237068 RepID=A0A8H4PJR8_9HYPO|nr:hypothetical protein FALBO_7379 [Fusarium albosuccineum]
MSSSQESGQARQETFKEQLDKAADNTREAENQKPNPIVEKITEYVPAAAKILPTGKQSPSQEENKPEGPPERPHHDDKIEEFVRDQHRSTGTDGILGSSSNDE